MADRNFDREPRWNNTGYWTDREENDPRESGDRSRARNYDRGDQRRYGRQSQEQAERLRSLRGQGPDPRPEQYERQGRNRGDDSGYGERELYRGYGTQIARNEGRFDDRDRDHDRDRDRSRGQDMRSAYYDDDYDYDFERDYRNNENTGRDMNLEGRGDPGRQMRDPYRSRGSYGSRGYSGEERGVQDERDWREEQARARDRQWEARGQDRSRDRQDNYWGAREQERRYSRGKDAWWQNTGGRPDFTSARAVGTDRSGWEGMDAERDYDMDPGYQYEFGTDFDFMRDTSLDEARRREEQHRRQQSGGRQQGGGRREPGMQGSRGQEFDRWGTRSSQREAWNVPGPYSGKGPGGYKRSDERIQEEICEIFTRHGQLDATGVEIEVKEGQVTLLGNVNRKNEKYLAEDLAANVMGVQDVENRIHVQAAGADARVIGAGRDNVVMPGRIQAGMRVAGVDGKHIGKVKETRADGFLLERAEGGDSYIPFRAVKRTNGQVFLHVSGGEIDRQSWKEA